MGDQTSKSVIIFHLQIKILLALLSCASFSAEKTRQIYRDLMGFMVADKKRYFQITIGK